MARAVLLTGRPGVGKTTVIQQAVEKLGRPAGGFYTREMRAGGKRVGFEMVTLDGERPVLAHVDFEGPERLGKYHVDVAALEGVGVRAVRRSVEAGRLVVIDEIGPMEAKSGRFREAVIAVLDSDAPLLGTIHRRSTPFTDAITSREDVTVIEVTHANRDDLPARVAAMVAG